MPLHSFVTPIKEMKSVIALSTGLSPLGDRSGTSCFIVNPANEPVGKRLLGLLGCWVYFVHIVIGTALRHRYKHTSKLPAQLHD